VGFVAVTVAVGFQCFVIAVNRPIVAMASFSLSRVFFAHEHAIFGTEAILFMVVFIAMLLAFVGTTLGYVNVRVVVAFSVFFFA
jgi:hypothetical protein